jgi:hypothetical protein
VSLTVSLTVWDMILGHPTDTFSQVADPVFTLSLNRSIEREYGGYWWWGVIESGPGVLWTPGPRRRC